MVRASRRTWWVWQPLVAALIFFYSGIWPIGVAAVACAILAFIHNSKVVDEEKAIDSTRDERVESPLIPKSAVATSSARSQRLRDILKL